nr:MAG TPA: hypothetical protein [Caudoviricetes sp.]
MQWLCTRLYILLGYLICFVFDERRNKDMKFKNLALFYVNLILEGKCTYAEVPRKLKPYVKQVAIDLGVWEIVEGGTEENPATPSNATNEE